MWHINIVTLENNNHYSIEITTVNTPTNLFSDISSRPCDILYRGIGSLWSPPEIGVYKYDMIYRVLEHNIRYSRRVKCYNWCISYIVLYEIEKVWNAIISWGLK